jgi:hypothetical protein
MAGQSNFTRTTVSTYGYFYISCAYDDLYRHSLAASHGYRNADFHAHLYLHTHVDGYHYLNSNRDPNAYPDGYIDAHPYIHPLPYPQGAYSNGNIKSLTDAGCWHP